jgi:hypothetical protein
MGMVYVYNILLEIPQGKTPLGKSRYKWGKCQTESLSHRVGGCGLDSAGSG